MASSKNESTLFALKIFDLLVQEPLKGLDLQQVTNLMQASRSTTHRALKTLEASGWVEAVKTGSTAVNWKVSTRFLRAAHTHRKQVIAEMNRLDNEYKAIAGEDLNYD